jgi:hypothetical protein
VACRIGSGVAVKAAEIAAGGAVINDDGADGIPVAVTQMVGLSREAAI